MQSLMELIAEMAALISGDEGAKEPDGFKGKREAVLQVTGRVWGVCDALIGISEMGMVGVGMGKAREWEALVKDAVEEVEGWDPDADDDDDDFDMDGDSEDEEEVVEEEEEGNGQVVNGTELSSTDEPVSSDSSPQTADIHAAKTKVLKFLKLLKMLYPALRKRRISTYPPFTRLDATSSLPPRHQAKRFSDILAFLQDFSSATDDLAGVLYDRDPDLVQAKMELMTTTADRCVDGVRIGWNEEEDEFSEWSGKWIARLKAIIGGTSAEESSLVRQYDSLNLE
ncbi:MAG: hypothetical protein Q9168_006774 [Polycauliona sp. 1 TL-2023]